MVPPCRYSGSPPCLSMWAVHDHLVVGVPGGDAGRFLKCAPEEVALSTSPQALLTATGQHAWVALVRLAMILGLIVMSLPWPQ
jgi:hypothetical protein